MGRSQFAAEARLAVRFEWHVKRIGGADHQSVGIGEHVLTFGLGPAPPGGDVRERQRLAGQHLRKPRQKRHEGACFENARPQRVDERDAARPQSRQQAGGAEPRAFVELHRVRPTGVEPAPEHADRLRTGYGAHHQLTVDDGQILTLEKRHAEIAGDIGVLEIGVVHRAGREDTDTAVVLAPEMVEAVAKCLEEARHAAHPGIAVKSRETVHRGHAVFERVAGARGRLGPVTQHPPAAVRPPADIEGDIMQEAARGRFHADQRPKPFRISGNEHGGKMTLPGQPVVAVEIGKNEFEKIGALAQAVLDFAPFGLGDQHRHRTERPVAFSAVGVSVLAVEDAGLAQIARAAGELRVELLGRP